MNASNRPPRMWLFEPWPVHCKTDKFGSQMNLLPYVHHVMFILFTIQRLAMLTMLWTCIIRLTSTFFAFDFISLLNEGPHNRKHTIIHLHRDTNTHAHIGRIAPDNSIIIIIYIFRCSLLNYCHHCYDYRSCWNIMRLLKRLWFRI